MRDGVGRALFPKQKDAIRKIHSLRGQAGLYMEMRTGKTRATLAYLDWRKCKRVLVVGSLSLAGVWENECNEIGYPLDFVDLAAIGSIADRAKYMYRVHEGIVFVNYESYWREPLRTAILKWQPEAVVLDEGHKIRHRTSKHSKFAHVLHDKGVPIRLLLTGTPSVNGLQDIWSMFRFIDDRVFGRRYLDFESEYIVKGGFNGYQIRGYRNEDRAHDLIEQHSYQAKSDANIESEDVPVPVRLEPETQKIYNELKKYAVAEVEGAIKNHKVVARIALTLIIRLQQITSGFVRDEADQAAVTISSEKIDTAVALTKDAAEVGRRVVVFARFVHDIEATKTALERAGLKVATLVGSQTSRERTEVIRGFEQEKFDVLVAQIRVAALGIDLTAASVAIFVSVGFSLDEFLQAKARLLGPAQKRSVTFYHLMARGTVDEHVYKALREKVNIAGRITNLGYTIDFLGKNA